MIYRFHYSEFVISHITERAPAHSHAFVPSGQKKRMGAQRALSTSLWALQHIGIIHSSCRIIEKGVSLLQDSETYTQSPHGPCSRSQLFHRPPFPRSALPLNKMAASSTDMAVRVSIGACTPTGLLLAEPQIFPAPLGPVSSWELHYPRRPALGESFPALAFFS